MKATDRNRFACRQQQQLWSVLVVFVGSIWLSLLLVLKGCDAEQGLIAPTNIAKAQGNYRGGVGDAGVQPSFVTPWDPSTEGQQNSATGGPTDSPTAARPDSDPMKPYFFLPTDPTAETWLNGEILKDRSFYTLLEESNSGDNNLNNPEHLKQSSDDVVAKNSLDGTGTATGDHSDLAATGVKDVIAAKESQEGHDLNMRPSMTRPVQPISAPVNSGPQQTRTTIPTPVYPNTVPSYLLPVDPNAPPYGKFLNPASNLNPLNVNVQIANAAAASSSTSRTGGRWCRANDPSEPGSTIPTSIPIGAPSGDNAPPPFPQFFFLEFEECRQSEIGACENCVYDN